MNVLLFTRFGRLAPGTRARLYQYLPYLEGHGMTVRAVPLFRDDYVRSLYANGHRPFGSILAAYVHRLTDLPRIRQVDLVWTQYELLPWLPAWAEAFPGWFGVPYVVDYDDAVFHRYDQSGRWLVRRLLGHKIDGIMRRSALVIAGNDYLMARAQRAGASQVAYLPTVIDLDRYRLPRVQPPERRVFRVGWIGTPITAKYLELVQPVLDEMGKDDDIQLVLVGSGPVHIQGIRTEIYPWSEETEAALIQSFDVGIMPLPDDPWERGKCGYKLIQYMAGAKPVVASPVGINRQIVQNGHNGFLASSPQEWVQALNALRGDPGLRTRMGQAGRARVEAEYCIQVTAPRLQALLCGAAGVRP